MSTDQTKLSPRGVPMSTDPVVYDAVKHRHPSLCSACITRHGNTVQMLTGYCVTACRCNGCGRICDLALCVISKPLIRLDAMDQWKQTIPPTAKNHMVQPMHPDTIVDGRTGTQNRPYPPGTLMVRATLTVRGVPSTWDFNWNDRDSVRRFAADSDRCIRAGGSSILEQVKKGT